MTRRITISFFITVCFFNYGNVYSQNKYFNEWEEISQLKSSGIDTFLVYTPNIGATLLKQYKGYPVFNSYYFIWCQGGKYRIQKISECLDRKGETFSFLRFKVLSVDTSSSYLFFINNIPDLRKDTFQNGVVVDTIDNKPVLIELKSTHHPIYTVLSFIVKGREKFSQSISNDMIESGIVYNEDGSIRRIRKNINYLKNTSTYSYKLIQLLERELGKLEANDAFLLD